MVLLEEPTAATGLSENLTGLLADNSIIKVFCDNTSQNDNLSLGVTLTNTDRHKSFVYLEDIPDALMGSVSVKRGLLKILSLAIPELSSVRIAKDRLIGRFALR
jgi:hypothetical protein